MKENKLISKQIDFVLFAFSVHSAWSLVNFYSNFNLISLPISVHSFLVITVFRASPTQLFKTPFMRRDKTENLIPFQDYSVMECVKGLVTRADDNHTGRRSAEVDLVDRLAV